MVQADSRGLTQAPDYAGSLNVPLSNNSMTLLWGLVINNVHRAVFDFLTAETTWPLAYRNPNLAVKFASNITNILLSLSMLLATLNTRLEALL